MIFFAVDAPIPGTDSNSDWLALFKSTAEAGAVFPPFFSFDCLAVPVAVALCALLGGGAQSSRQLTAIANHPCRSIRITTCYRSYGSRRRTRSLLFYTLTNVP